MSLLNLKNEAAKPRKLHMKVTSIPVHSLALSMGAIERRIDGQPSITAMEDSGIILAPHSACLHELLHGSGESAKEIIGKHYTRVPESYFPSFWEGTIPDGYEEEGMLIWRRQRQSPNYTVRTVAEFMTKAFHIKKQRWENTPSGVYYTTASLYMRIFRFGPVTIQMFAEKTDDLELVNREKGSPLSDLTDAQEILEGIETGASYVYL